MKPAEIKAALNALGKRPNKRLGQYFLIDRSVINAAVEAAGIRAGDRVLEIGPGLGVLTRVLLDRGASVVAIERDRAFVERLQSAYRDRDLRVVHGDAAAVHWHELIGDSPWKFVSNLPYAITSLALRKSLYSPRPPRVIVVLIQREVAERMTGSGSRLAGRKTSLLSLMAALASESVRIIRKVPPGCFYPAPKIQSVLFEIVPMTIRDREKKWGIDPEDVMKAAKAGFAHPRKLLISNLAAGAWRAMPKRDIQTILQSLGANPKSRAEDLTVGQWVELARRLK
jgi:16S rRNA (adenine1518-N6/adenine1519-N6)-dimethyltransferase